jgi:hypothetical protein
MAGQAYTTAMVPCDHVHVDPQTGKLYVMGPFFAVGVPRTPFEFGAMAFYAVVTNARGPHVASVTILDPDDDELSDLYQEISLEFADEKQRFQIYFHYEDVVFERTGEHVFVLRLSGEIVNLCRLDVNLVEGP